MFAQFVNVLYSIVDRIYVGNIPVTGADALAGAGVCAPIVTLLSSFGTLFGIGGSVLFSVRLGAGDEKGARRILGNSFSLMLIVSVILTVLFLLTKDYLLNWFGASSVTFPYADDYMTIYTAGTVFALLSMGMNYFITAQGFPLLGMMTTLIGAVINIVLDPVFIFLLHMDIAGAAAATVIAQASSCIFVLCTLRRKTMKIPLTLMRPEKQIGIQIAKIGFSPFLILATDSIIIIAMNAVLQHYGGAEYGDTLVTAATIVQSYMLLITSPMLGITGGSQPLISYNYGADKPDRIRKIFFWVLMLCFCFTAVMFLVSRIMPQYFVRIFTDNPEYEELAVWGIRAFTLMIVPLSFQYVIVDGLTALGMTRCCRCSSRRRARFTRSLWRTGRRRSCPARSFSLFTGNTYEARGGFRKSKCKSAESGAGSHSCTAFSAPAFSEKRCLPQESAGRQAEPARQPVFKRSRGQEHSRSRAGCRNGGNYL